MSGTLNVKVVRCAVGKFQSEEFKMRGVPAVFPNCHVFGFTIYELRFTRPLG